MRTTAATATATAATKMLFGTVLAAGAVMLACALPGEAFALALPEAGTIGSSGSGTTEATATTVPWTDAADTSWYTDGPEDGWYEIGSPEQLAGLASLIGQGVTFEGANIALTADIDLSGETTTGATLLWAAPPIDKPFCGTFYGNGYEIEGMTATGADAALFGSVEGGSLQEVLVTGSATGSSRAAGVAVRAVNESLAGCESAVSVGSENAGATLGGLVAEADGCSFDQCMNLAQVYGASQASAAYAGGLAGVGSDLTFEGCTNKGAVGCAAVAGGFVGRVSAGMAGSGLSAVRCVNTGAVGATVTAGGFAGRCEAPLSARESVNLASVQGGGFSLGAEAAAGGFAGTVEGALTVTDSIANGGAWAYAGASSPQAAAGGFAGRCDGTAAFVRSYAGGTNSATGAVAKKAGAFVGDLADSASASAERCFYVTGTADAAVGQPESALADVPVASYAEAPLEVRTLGSAFAFSKYYRGMPALAWRVTTVTLTYEGADGAALDMVNVESGASVTSSDVAALYGGATPETTPPAGQVATFAGWSSEAASDVAPSFESMTADESVYAVFTYAPAPNAGGASGEGNEGSGTSSGSGSQTEQTGQGTGDVLQQVDQWVKAHSKWWYRHADGSYTQNGWEYIAGHWYFFDADGWMQTGWLHTGGRWYYLTASGAMATGWDKVDGTWYYFNEKGQGTEGAMRTGWLHQDGTWYYLTRSGAMKTGWLSWKGDWYLLLPSGAMAEGWQKVDGAWYYLSGPDRSPEGAMVTGWLHQGGTWYYLTRSGAMKTGWLKWHNRWYYLYPDGAMAANTTVDGYRLDASGAWVR